jgi:phospholipase/carboxylesterase
MTAPLETIIAAPKLPAQSSIIWLHGLGADAQDFVDMVPQLQLPEQLAIRFIFPHAPVRPVTLNAGMAMRAWFDIYGLTADFPQDEVGINQTDLAISKLIEDEIKQGIPSQKVFLGGFSQGGAVALYSGIRYPQRLGGILGLSTFLPKNHGNDVNRLNINQGIPIFMAHGTQDPILSYEIGQASKDRLAELGYSVEWHTYNMGHTVSNQEIHDLSQWVIKVLS